MDSISLNLSERTQICAFINRTEFYWTNPVSEALYRSTSGMGKPTMYGIIEQKMKEKFGISLMDYSVYNLSDIRNSKLEDEAVIIVASLCRVYVDARLPVGMESDISGLEMEEKINDILDRANIHIHITSEGIKKIDEDFQTELAQKFQILGSNNQAEIDFNKWSTSYPIAILFFDVDNFKTLNTRYTESVVDEHILIPLQKLISEIVKERGGAYSFGGDEFIIILKNVNPEETMAFSERLQKKISNTKFCLRKDIISLTISIGCALYPNNGHTYTEVLDKANLAENRAKKKGKNCIILTQ